MDIVDQVIDGELSPSEYNQHIGSNQNVIESSGQILSNSDLFQLAKATASYATVSSFYTDSGIANAYVFDPIANFQAPSAYEVGLLVRARIANENTGASTINVATLGVVNIKLADGTTDPGAGDIPTDKDSVFRFDGTSFLIIESGSGSAGGLTITRTQTTHGFVIGNVLKLNGTTYETAQADSAANAEVVAIVSEVKTADDFVLHSYGRIEGLSGFTAGEVQFLSPTIAGTLTNVEPILAGQINKPLLIADTTTSGYFVNMRGVEITSIANKVGSFKVFLSVAQSIADNTVTKIQFADEVFDKEGWYDNVTNFRYTPQVAGQYMFGVTSGFAVDSAIDIVQAEIHKNATAVAINREMSDLGGTNIIGESVTTMVDMNGSTDFIEFFTLQDSSPNASKNTLTSEENIFAYGFLVEPA